MNYAYLFGLGKDLMVSFLLWAFANIPTAKLIAFSTGPCLTVPARMLHMMCYCRSKGRIRQRRVMMVGKDYSRHMLVAAPLPKFMDSFVKEHRSTAAGEPA